MKTSINTLRANLHNAWAAYNSAESAGFQLGNEAELRATINAAKIALSDSAPKTKRQAAKRSPGQARYVAMLRRNGWL